MNEATKLRRTRLRRAAPLPLAVLALAFLLLAACTGSDDDPTPTASPAPTESATATPEVPPTATASPAPTATRVPRRDPTIAPDGRTGFPEVDALIETVLTADQPALAALYDGPALRACREGLGPQPDMSAAEWQAMLAASDRSLYAAIIGNRSPTNPTEFRLIFAIEHRRTAGESPAIEGWSFALGPSGVQLLQVGCDAPPPAFVVDVAANYRFFLVLPPREDLPTAPPAHALTARTGLTDVDTLLEVLETADRDALLALVDYQTQGTSEILPQQECRNEPTLADRETVEKQLPSLTASGMTLHGVAVVPDGFRVTADYTVILVNPGDNPYQWVTDSLYLRDGRIVRWDIGCDGRVDLLYPPAAYLVLPGGDFDGKSGVEVIDDALAALAARDLDALVSVVDWQLVGCLEPGVSLGIGQPPYCEDDEQPGDLVETLSFTQCEGALVGRQDAIRNLSNLLQEEWSAYAIADLGEPQTDFGYEARYQVVLTNDTSEFAPVRSLFFTTGGLRIVSSGCGTTDPNIVLLTGNTPDFLLPPPSDG